MVYLSRIYTKTGDKGDTALGDGTRVPKDHPRVEFLRLKGLAAWKDWPAGPWLGTPEALAKVRGVLRDAAPLNEWLEKYVGPSMLPAQRR